MASANGGVEGRRGSWPDPCYHDTVERRDHRTCKWGSLLAAVIVGIPAVTGAVEVWLTGVRWEDASGLVARAAQVEHDGRRFVAEQVRFRVRGRAPAAGQIARVVQEEAAWWRLEGPLRLHVQGVTMTAAAARYEERTGRLRLEHPYLEGASWAVSAPVGLLETATGRITLSGGVRGWLSP